MIALADLAPFLRPSSLEAAEACPGRPQMELRATRLEPLLLAIESEPARQGTLGHEVIAGVIRDAFCGDWSNAAHIIAGIEGRMAGLAHWTKDGVRACVAYGYALVARLHASYGSIQVLVEQPLDGRGLGLPKGGTADLILLCYAPDGSLMRVVIIDHKLGFLSQGEAADHLQLGTYAAMAWRQWHPTHGIEVHLSAGRRHEFSSALYRAEDIQAVSARIRAVVQAATAEAPPLRVSKTGCLYCRAKPFCTALREHLMTAADDLALFGANPEDRARLADDAAIAKRFAADADQLAKLWRASAAAARYPTHPTAGTAGFPGA